MGSLADAVLPLVRTRTDLHRWSAANSYGHGVHQAVALLRAAAHTQPAAEVLPVTQRALATALKAIARADDSSGIIGDATRTSSPCTPTSPTLLLLHRPGWWRG